VAMRRSATDGLAWAGESRRRGRCGRVGVEAARFPGPAELDVNSVVLHPASTAVDKGRACGPLSVTRG
jgi:hypothetical protein